jgi:hypothetical protein
MTSMPTPNETADVLPSAKDCLRKMAEVEARKAVEQAKKERLVRAEKQRLLDQLTMPSGVDEDQRMRRAAAIINRAVNNGLTEVEVGRFSNTLFTDGGRAINQQERGWEATMTGLPKELYEFWATHLKPRGYRIKAQVADWPKGMPGDISLTLIWTQ